MERKQQCKQGKGKTMCKSFIHTIISSFHMIKSRERFNVVAYARNPGPQ